MRLPTALPSGLSGLPFSTSANTLTIQEAVERLTHMSMDQTAESNLTPSLIRGFKATVPSSELPKQRRRMIRGGLVDADLGYEKIGLKKLGDRARGLLTEGEVDEQQDRDGLGVGRRRKKRRERKDSRRLEGKLHLEDLVKQADEIAQDKENLNVRTVSRGGPEIV
jgi:division protein 1